MIYPFIANGVESKIKEFVWEGQKAHWDIAKNLTVKISHLVLKRSQATDCTLPSD